MSFRKDHYQVIGLMSGTSLDGLDIAFCEFSMNNGKWKYNIRKATTISFQEKLRDELKNAINLSGEELLLLDLKLGKWMGREVQSFLQQNSVKVDLIASHGHTIFHQPEKGLTHQIGDLNQIFIQNNIPVVGDFRSLDVALGGQGAPLVPIGDRLLFGEYGYCINLGGISNISYEDNKDQSRTAFDICPVNIVLNQLANQKGLAFDLDGKLGSKGIPNAQLLSQLDSIQFYQTYSPKSIGIEWIHEMIFPILDNFNISIEDKIATFCMHIAHQISNCITNAHSTKQKSRILLTGGGAFNQFLIKCIQELLKGLADCVVPDPQLVAFKEALIFAFLGVLKWRNELNVLSSVTGASRDSSSGIIITS